MSSADWKRDKEFSDQMQPFADEIYRKIWEDITIERYEREDGDAHILDQEYHIDTVVTLSNGMIFTMQEKFLRDRYEHYDTFTLEYYNDPATKEEGEWFKLCTDLYFTGYGNTTDGFHSAYLFYTAPVKFAIERGWLVGYKTDTTTSRANFYAFPFRSFQKSWFVYRQPLLKNDPDQDPLPLVDNSVDMGTTV